MLVGYLLKINKEFKNLKKQEIQAIFTKISKAFFQHDMAYGDFKDLIRRTAPDKILRDEAFNIAKNPKYDRYQRGLASIVYKFFDKKSTRNVVANDEIKQNLQLPKELHKPITRKFKKRKVYSGFRDTIWGADLADMQLISKFNKQILFRVIDIFSKYPCVIPLKDKKGISFVNAFQKILKESNRSEANSKGSKPNKTWADKGSEIFNNSF